MSPHDLAAAFTSLEETFGWAKPKFPSRADVAKMTKGRDFLDQGPYLDRAKALLEKPDIACGEDRPAVRRRLQAILDYLEDPIPIDAWKADIGTEPRALRLKHLLHTYVVNRGLFPKKRMPDILLNAASIDTRERALEPLKGADR